MMSGGDFVAFLLLSSQKLTMCLAEMMNPRFRFDLLGRADRVQCVK